jgi:hypothetical protein
MIARKQEISLQFNQSIDAVPGAPATLLGKERIDFAHATMRLRRGESVFIPAGIAHKPPELLRTVSRVILAFSLIKLDKVRRVVAACEFESVEGSMGADLTLISVERPKYDPCDPCSFSEPLRISPGFHCQEFDRSHHRRGVPDRSCTQLAITALTEKATSRGPASSGNEGLAFMENPSRGSSCARHSSTRKTTTLRFGRPERKFGRPERNVRSPKHKLYRHVNRTACYAAPFSCLLQLAIHISLKKHALP